ncbi:TLC domain-containing protein 2-like [Dendronephthya gigantea]|uniref:TLC domain-containing protein 2-like n=1 Tax=Dendronephthya gigantea TaxID=151771 RepID=UPI00106C6B4B|nr:TLC domain-containing protein 2-like [Dendronephthya gigantea]
MEGHINWVYISLSSMLFFKTINKAVVFLFPSPVKLRDQTRKVWLWENLATSWVHSVISAALSIYSIYSTPSIIEDMINTNNSLLYSTLAISVGYFVYDLIDLAINDLQRSFCVIIHHVLVISSFLVCLLGNRLIPFAIFALLVEVNSVFLHARCLMRMTELDQNGLVYKINRILLMITFILFRFVNCGWVTICLVSSRHVINWLPFTIGFGGMCIASLQNVGLLKQVWTSDAKSKMKQSQHEKTGGDKDHNENKSNGSEKLRELLKVTNACSTCS